MSENQSVKKATTLIHEISHFFGTKDYWYYDASEMKDNSPASVRKFINDGIDVAVNGPSEYHRAGNFPELDVEGFKVDKAKKIKAILNNADSVAALALILAQKVVEDFQKKQGSR